MYVSIDPPTMKRLKAAINHAVTTADWRLCQCIKTALVFEYHVNEDDIITLVKLSGVSARAWTEAVSAAPLCH